MTVELADLLELLEDCARDGVAPPATFGYVRVDLAARRAREALTRPPHDDGPTYEDHELPDPYTTWHPPVDLDPSRRHSV